MWRRSNSASERLFPFSSPTYGAGPPLDACGTEFAAADAAMAVPLDSGRSRLAIVPHATHLFEEPGALELVSYLARDWFLRHLQPVPHH